MMAVPQAELGTALNRSELMLEGVKYLQLVMTATERELSAPPRIGPCGQARDFLS